MTKQPKTEKPTTGEGNNMGGGSLNQPGPKGGMAGSSRHADGSLNQKGAGHGQNSSGVVSSGFGSTPIPKSEQ